MRKPQPSSVIDLVTIMISAVMAAIGLVVFFAGPEALLPVHWGADGLADGWANRQAVGGAFLALGLLTMLVAGGMGLAAMRAEEVAGRRALRITQVIALIALTGVGLFAGTASLAGASDMNGALPMAGASLLLLAMGALLGRVGRNRLVGVRTPWSYRSKPAWERSNRLAGRLLFLLGLAGLATAPLAIQPFGYQALGLGVLIAAAWSVFESWRVWRADPDRQT